MTIPIRVNRAEKAEMTKRASEMGMQVSEYLRMLGKSNETEGDVAESGS